MGILDDALKQFTQGGGNAQQQPLIVVLQELLVGKPQQPGARQASQQQEAEVPQSSAAPQGGAGAGGLGGLLAQLQAAGLDDAVRSWIGTGENKPVQPEDLGDALGKRAVTPRHHRQAHSGWTCPNAGGDQPAPSGPVDPELEPLAAGAGEGSRRPLRVCEGRDLPAHPTGLRGQRHLLYAPVDIEENCYA
jgi:uncharacterized protein YidB (DUF937 family)